MNDAKHPEPTFKKQDFMTIATIKNYTLNKDVPNNVPNNVPKNTHQSNIDSIIIKLIKENPKITRTELAKFANKSVKTIQRILKENPKIKRVGSPRSGHWEIKEQ